MAWAVSGLFTCSGRELPIGLPVEGPGLGASRTAYTPLPPSLVGRTPNARESTATTVNRRPCKSGSKGGCPRRAGPWSRTGRRRAPLSQTTDRPMTVPALIAELATSALTTMLAEGMTRLNCQSSRVRVTRDFGVFIGVVGSAHPVVSIDDLSLLTVSNLVAD